ncbi:hypothetical protein MNQ98_08735 [Paenibacillus sp. N3/727]|uniref:coiled-coil domain-containing protein n=1 Tax=Paenibacillus sp. N3/727 TaxID=2925845 RepID=UPI001F531D65|nr:hypothetical protein [Paenibacillus sp. N3/727]UNK20084.1 hypothetical protein MNQ98_08735 [Paenibacillus sp. N3/727]
MIAYKPRLYIILFLCMLLITGTVVGTKTAFALPETTAVDSEEARKLLEDSLSIVEIDHEIERIGKRQKELEQIQNSLETKISNIELQIQERQEQAGIVLRAYYMGERESLLNLLLSAQSLTGFFRILDFYDLIIQNDQAILRAYNQQYKELVSAQTKASRNADQLTEVKDNLVKQRARVLALEEQVNGALASSSNPQAMAKLIEEFTLYWENVGIYEVKRHFQALAGAMNNLPAFIQGSKNMLKTNGKEYTININENDLNEFLRSEDELFNTFAFHFDDGKISAEGESGNLSLLIEGRYTIINDPENAIMFQIDKLVFNRLELPDTTRQALQNEFDMNFYPKQLVSFLKATEVSTDNKVLFVKLELDM